MNKLFRYQWVLPPLVSLPFLILSLLTAINGYFFTLDVGLPLAIKLGSQHYIGYFQSAINNFILMIYVGTPLLFFGVCLFSYFLHKIGGG